MKTILLPTDFSAPAANATRYAAVLASRTKSKLILLHVVEPEVLASPEGGVISLPSNPRLEHYSEEKLLMLSKDLQLENGFEVETASVSGELQEQLNNIIRHKQVDLVVMGTKGAHNFLEKLAGTNTISFIREAGCPVLIIPENISFNEIKSIAYASDFETREEGIYLQQLLAFAQPFAPVMYIINIRSEEHINLVPDDEVLGHIQEQFPNNSFRIAQLMEDDVVAGIQQFIKDNEIDIVAVSIKEKNFLEKLFHHSITRQLASASPVPLLTLPTHPILQQPLANADKPA